MDVCSELCGCSYYALSVLESKNLYLLILKAFQRYKIESDVNDEIGIQKIGKQEMTIIFAFPHNVVKDVFS